MSADNDPLPLPSTRTRQWTIARKAAVIQGVRRGLITLEQACERYRLSLEEFYAWERDFDAHGAKYPSRPLPQQRSISLKTLTIFPRGRSQKYTLVCVV